MVNVKLLVLFIVVSRSQIFICQSLLVVHFTSDALKVKLFLEQKPELSVLLFQGSLINTLKDIQPTFFFGVPR